MRVQKRVREKSLEQVATQSGFQNGLNSSAGVQKDIQNG